MALNVSGWAIRRPLPPLLLFAALLVVGLASFRALPVTNMPEIRVPVISVTIGQRGAAPAELEAEVARPVEAAVASLVGVREVVTTVADGQSETEVEFELDVPVDRALDDVRDAVARIRGDLPGAVEEPVIRRVEMEGGPVATYVVEAPLLPRREMAWLIDDALTRALLDVRGVSRIERQGGAAREIRVELDPARLRAFGVTAAEVSAELARTLRDESGGRAEIGAQEQSLRVLSGVADMAGLAALDLALPGGRRVALGDLATVTDGEAEVRGLALRDGAPVTAFAVFLAPGQSAPAVAARVAAAVAAFAAARDDVAIERIDSSVPEIESDFAAAMDTLIEGAILAVIVVYLFLRDFRATIIAALAIPLSVIPTFWVLDLLGFSLNTISLLAVTLVTGVLVDDAIVEIENIVRHMRGGKSAYAASMEAADEIGMAVVATSATIIAVFLPVSFMGGIAGQYFKQFGITVAVAVAFSLLVARLITPLLTAYFLKDGDHPETAPDRVTRGYARVLGWCLGHRRVTILGGLAFFVASIWLTTLLPTGLFPDEDSSRAQLSFELPPGVTPEQGAATLALISDRLRAHPEVASVYASLGDGEDIRTGTASVTLVPRAERVRDQQGFERAALADIATIPDLRANFVTGMEGRAFAMSLTGPDGPALTRAAAAIETAIAREVPDLRNVQTRAALERPELRVVPRPLDAAALGVPAAEIAATLGIASIGDVSRNLAAFADKDRRIDIRVRLPESARRDMASLETLELRGANGAAVPLAAVADIVPGAGPARVERLNGERRVLIEADLAPGASLGPALARVMTLDAVKSLPEGTRFAEAGDAEIMGEMFAGFLTAMGAGLMLILIVLILLYEDLFQPVTILLSLPLSIGGAMLALLLTGNAIGMPAVIGILMLLGIVTKNAILLVDFAIEEIRRGAPRETALIEAGLKRARPIVMTTIAMSAGMAPAALAFADGGAFRAPMAIAVIGGLVTSTALSLVFVPAVFTYVDDLEHLLGRLLGRLVTRRKEVAR